MSTFLPIADYGFLSDCENNCLVAPDGSIEWLSLPRPDSPSVFGTLWIEAPGAFGSGRPTPTFLIIADTYRGQWYWRRHGTLRRDGWW